MISVDFVSLFAPPMTMTPNNTARIAPMIIGVVPLV